MNWSTIHRRFGAYFLLLALLAGCKEAVPEQIPPPRKGELAAQVLASAGSTDVWNWNPASGTYKKQTGAALDFLPYPCNYGYLTDTEKGSRPQEVLILGRRLEEGQTLGVTPIAVLRCREAGQPRPFLLVQPTAFPPQSVKARNFRQFFMEYDGAKRILETWVLHHRGYGTLEFVGWGGEESYEVAGLRSYEAGR